VSVQRGDIVIAELSPTKGSEQAGTRPCVVVQNDTGNKYSPTTIVAPCTTRYDPEDLYPVEVELRASRCDLKDDSVVNCSQLRTVDIDARITGRVGTVPPDRMEDIDEALHISLSLSMPG
jgi:mRNA interferase MazF